MASSGMNINRIAPWRFLLFFAVLIAAWTIAIGAGAVFSRGLLIGFDVAAIAFLASYAPTIRFDAKLDLVTELLTTRLEDLEHRIGDRNTGFVEGYMLSHATTETSIPEAPVVQLTPRGPRRVHHGED